MKKTINYSIFYAIIGALSGIFFREFTKYNHFSGPTALGTVHTHYLVLGTLFYLILALFISRYENIVQDKQFSLATIVYNVGLVATTTMMLVRGIIQVLSIQPSRALDASVSGLAGLSHIALGCGLLLLLFILKRNVDVKQS